MSRLLIALLILLIPLVLLSAGLSAKNYTLAKTGFLILLFFIVLGVLYGEDKLHGKK
jgi:uncharacterized membrane protein